MTTRSKNITQSKRIAEALEAIAPDVTANDRKEVCEHLSLTKASISIYLSGKVHDNDTGIKILSILRKNIAAREKQLAQLIS